MGLEEVTYNIITRNRPWPLSMAMTSLLSQPPDWSLLVYDSSDRPVDQDIHVKAVADALEAQGVFVRFEHGPKLGIPKSFQASAEMAETPYVIRQEDDQLVQPGYIEELYRVMSAHKDTKVLGVGGAICRPDPPRSTPMAAPDYLVAGLLLRTPESALRDWNWKTDGPFLEPYDQQQYNYVTNLDRLHKVPHLHGTFIYKREQFLANGGFWRDGPWIGHREETLATLRDYFAGWDWLVTLKAKSWHLEYPTGGSRDMDMAERHRLQCAAELTFQEIVQRWIKEHPERPVHIGPPETYVPPANTEATSATTCGTAA